MTVRYEARMPGKVKTSMWRAGLRWDNEWRPVPEDISAERLAQIQSEKRLEVREVALTKAKDMDLVPVDEPPKGKAKKASQRDEATS